MTDETLHQLSEKDLLLKLFERFDTLEKRLDTYDAQFEAIREGISYNATRLDRLEGNFLLLRADFRELSDEIRKDKLALK